MQKLIIAALLIAATVAPVQTHASKNRSRDEIRFTLVLSRHGVRPPIIANSVLNPHSSDPWPEWEVPLGFLTPHGALALRQMGAYMRLDFARNGLFPVTGCPGSNEIYLYSDTDERNIMSTRNTFAGLEPGCSPLPVNTIVQVPHMSDPLFMPYPGTFQPPSAESIEADRRAVMGSDPGAYYSLAGNPKLRELARILAPDPTHPAAKPILDDPRPLTAASSLIEDFLLEYTDGKPMPQVGWGRVDESTLRRLMPLYVKGFNLVTRSPLTARTRGSNLMAHILDTLEQAAQPAQTQPAKPVPGAVGPVGTRLVYISGHDGNLCNLGGLLNLHWSVENIADDTPPDSQIVFELWQNSKSKQYTVRLYFRAQTYNQLRSGDALTLANPPVEVEITPPGCRSGQPCPFTAFDRAAHSLLDPAYVKPDLLPTQITPANP
jgi:4-phytase/acid phosphatase